MMRVTTIKEEGMKKTIMALHQEWSHGLCEPSCKCAAACFVPCVIFAENVSRMEKHGINPIPVVDDCPTLCSKQLCGGSLYGIGTAGMYLKSFGVSDPCGCLYGIAQCFSIFIHMKVRHKIRTVYNIPAECCECCDGECSDFCNAMCCYSCALAQENIMLEESPPKKENKTDPAMFPIHLDNMEQSQ